MSKVTPKCDIVENRLHKREAEGAVPSALHVRAQGFSRLSKADQDFPERNFPRSPLFGGPGS